MSVQPSSEFRQETRSAIQEAANLFRQNKAGDAFDLLKIRISDHRKEFSEGQWQAFCKILHLNPNSEPIDFSNKEFQTFSLLRARALRDVVDKAANSFTAETRDIEEAILRAAKILELSGDMESAWKVLHEVLPAAMRKKRSDFREWISKEVYLIMLDDLRKPSSTFLQKKMKFMAKALDTLSLHFFDEKLLKGKKTEISASFNLSHATFSTLIPPQIYTILEADELVSLSQTSKAFKETAKSSLEFRTEATLEDLQKWLKKGILDKPLPALHVIKRENVTPLDERELESILALCPNLKILDLGYGSNGIKAAHVSVVGKCCPNLVSFSLSGFIDENDIAIANSYLQALSNCHKLKKVSLLNTHLVTFNIVSLVQFLKGCKELEDLELAGFDMARSEATISTIAKAGLPLKRIVISTEIDLRNGRAYGPNLTAAYIDLFKCNPRLEEVILRNNPYLRNDALIALAEHCPLITKLDLSFNWFITEEGLRAVVKKCKLLRHLDIEDFRGDISKVFEESPSHLTHINFKGIKMLPSQMVDFVRNNPDLISIQLPDGMTEEVLLAIRQSCQKLKYLRIKNNNGGVAEYRSLDTSNFLSALDFLKRPHQTLVDH